MLVESVSDVFHQHGHHVQKAHGRRSVKLASDGSHLSGGMIALMPTAADAKRLSVGGGERAADLHVTLFYLGDGDMLSQWSDEEKNELVRTLKVYASDIPGPVKAKIFGIAHWNAGSENPSWVWNVGDTDTGHDGHQWTPLSLPRSLTVMALEQMHEHPELPEQHTPWVAHICAAYTDDLSLAKTLEQRLGTVTFDRIRISFGDEDTDIPLTEAVTASASLRREPSPVELAAGTDFAGMHSSWESAVDRAVSELGTIFTAWRADLRTQIVAKLADDNPEALPGLNLDTLDATAALDQIMKEYAQRAGQAMQREAEKQGVTVPEWHLPEDSVAAAVGGLRLLSSIARMTSDLMASNMLTAAKRKLSGLLGSPGTPETIADQVRSSLGTDDTGLRSAVGTAMTAAQNAGRRAVLEVAPPGEYHASEILDRNTCAPCRAVDGEQFGDLERAVKAYPVMGYKDCVGPRYGNSCRGFIVARWAPAETASAATGEMHGSLGAPGYRQLHPGSGKSREGKTRHAGGGMVGSNLYSETEHEDVALDYGGRAYRDMNAWLRSRTPPQRATVDETQRRVSVMNDLIAIQDPIESEKTVWRGTRQLQLGLNVGDEFHDKGFVSTSKEEDLPRSFTGVGGTLFKITAPKGTRMLDMAGVGGDHSEKEFILPPGTKFRVTKVSDPGDPLKTTEYEIEVING